MKNNFTSICIETASRFCFLQDLDFLSTLAIFCRLNAQDKDFANLIRAMSFEDVNISFLLAQFLSTQLDTSRVSSSLILHSLNKSLRRTSSQS